MENTVCGIPLILPHKVQYVLLHVKSYQSESIFLSEVISLLAEYCTEYKNSYNLLKASISYEIKDVFGVDYTCQGAIVFRY